MSDIHITPELLEAVRKGDVPVRVLAELGWEHLMRLCPTCRESVEHWRRMHREPPAGYDAALRALPLLLERHSQDADNKREAAAKDLHTLLRMAPEDRLGRIRRSNTRFRGVLLAHRLIEEAKARMPAHPREVLHLAELAEAVLMRTAHLPGYFDVFTRASAYQANALRATGKLREAEERLASVRGLIRRENVTDALVYAEVDWFEGVLRKDQRRFREAESLLARAATLFRLAGETVEAARPLITLGAMHHHREEPAKAIAITEEALALLDPESEPRLYLCGRHNLALFLTEMGQYESAAETMRVDEELYARFADLWTKLRKLWLQGKIAFGTGRQEEAERAFLSVRDGFLSQGIGYDAAMVSLDLALLYLKEGRTQDVRQLAEEMHLIFRAEDIHREALAALFLFQEAAHRDATTVGLVEDLYDYLKRARKNPELRFTRQPQPAS